MESELTALKELDWRERTRLRLVVPTVASVVSVASVELCEGVVRFVVSCVVLTCAECG